MCIFCVLFWCAAACEVCGDEEVRDSRRIVDETEERENSSPEVADGATRMSAHELIPHTDHSDVTICHGNQTLEQAGQLGYVQFDYEELLKQ